MRKIVYTQQDGSVAVVTPCHGARLVFWITLADGTVLPKGANTPEAKDVPPHPADTILRRWPVEGAVAKWAETEDEFVQRIARKDVPVTLVNPPEGISPQMLRADAILGGFEFVETSFQTIDESAIPTDRAFRNGWKCGAGKVEHDMAKCREIQKNRLRELRAPKLAALDVDYMRALEAGDIAKAADIAAQKQALRDVTKDPAIDAATTVEDLKSVVPAILSGGVR